MSLILAWSVVKRQSIFAPALFRWRCHAATSRTNSSFDPMHRFRHCPVSVQPYAGVGQGAGCSFPPGQELFKGTKAVAEKYRVSPAWVRRLKQR